MFEALERRRLLAANPLGDWGATYEVVGALLVIEGTDAGEQVNIDDGPSDELLLYATDGTHVGQATVPVAGVALVIVRLYGGDDVLDATTLDVSPIAVHAWGGQGGDVLWGGASDDKLFGGSGDNVLVGGGGKDVLVP